MNKESLTDFIKDTSLSIGFSKVGIAKVEYYKEDKIHLDNWIENNYHATMSWMLNNKDKRTNISNYYNKSKSVISVAINYFNGNSGDNYNPPFISNYASGKDYHIIIKKKLENLLKEINKRAEKNSRVIDCLLQVHIAIESTKFGFNSSEISQVLLDSSVFQNIQITRCFAKITIF